MSRALGHRVPMNDAALPRLLATSAVAMVLAAGAHLTAGGAAPRTVEVLLSAVGLVAASTWLAGAVGRRTRGLSGTAASLAAGQGGMELLLWSVGHGVGDPLLAAGLHAGAVSVLVVLVLGVARVEADVQSAADRSLSGLCGSEGPTQPASRGPLEVTAYNADDAGAPWWPEACPARGPPLPI